MKDTILQIFVDALYLVALINPISKVSVLCLLSSGKRQQEFLEITTKASVVAFGMLLGAMVFGEFLLSYVFHVQLHSLMLAGGGVLCWVGFNALRKGVFFEQQTERSFHDMALVPLACPMIAGPATIAACMALQAKSAFLPAAISLVLAIAINHLVMHLSRPIGAALMRFNILGALIRITGLIVMTIGVQMALNGISAWQAGLMSNFAAGELFDATSPGR